MKGYAIISKNRLGDRIYRKLIGWTLDPYRAAICSDKPTSEPFGLVVSVRNWQELAKKYPPLPRHFASNGGFA